MSSPACPPPSLVLYSSGSNAENQLSHSQQEDSHVFLPCVTSASGSSTSELNSSFPPPRTRSILQLAFGANHTTCLLETEHGRRQIWGCGDGEGGQLGLTVDGEGEGSSKEGEGGGARGGGFRKLKLPPLPKEVLVELERRAEGTYCYQPIKIAASWTTTFIAFSATLLLPSSTSSVPPPSRRPSPDLLLAMGTNDFAELGNGRRGRASEEERFCWHVFQDEKIVDLVSGPRHVVLHLANESGRRLVGWGAARHGQLSTPLSTIPLFNELETPPPPPATPAAVLLVPTPLPSTSPSLLDPLTQLALGLHHTLILRPKPSPFLPHLQIHGRPSNPATQISLSPPSLDASSSTILQIASTWSSSVLLLSHQFNSTSTPAHSILSYSKSLSEPLAFPPNATSPSLRAGSEHVLVLLSVPGVEKGAEEEQNVREVWGWGWNEHGNMGDGGVGDWEGKDGLRRVWPSSRPSASSSSKDVGAERGGERVVDCWAGNGTSWVLVERG